MFLDRATKSSLSAAVKLNTFVPNEISTIWKNSCEMVESKKNVKLWQINYSFGCNQFFFDKMTLQSHWTIYILQISNDVLGTTIHFPEEMYRIFEAGLFSWISDKQAV